MLLGKQRKLRLGLHIKFIQAAKKKMKFKNQSPENNETKSKSALKLDFSRKKREKKIFVCERKAMAYF